MKGSHIKEKTTRWRRALGLNLFMTEMMLLAVTIILKS